MALSAADQAALSFESFFTHIVLHEMMHGLGAVAPCAPNFTPIGGGHVTTPNDLMFHTANGVAKTIDPGHDDYFGHSIPGCIDLQDSPYLANVAG